MAKRRKVVTVLLPAVASSMRDIVRGIADYAEAAGNWHLVLHLWGQVGEADVQWINRGDGLIFEEPLSSSPVRPSEWTVPAVAVQMRHLAKKHPLVSTDYREVGYRAGLYFLKKGLPNLAYLSYAKNDEAEDGIRRAAREAGRALSIHYLGPGQPELDPKNRRDLVRWLAELPPPVGVLVRDDFLAQKVMDWIPPEWMPERIAVLGVGNDSIICELTRPTLSSVDRDARRIGRKAAELLDRILGGESVPPQPFLLEPGSIVERQSTGLSYTPDPLVTRAIRLIEENLAEAPGTDELCARLKVSRSTLEKRFTETLGHSIWKHRQHLQIDRAKYLLVATREPMSDIAQKSGFTNQQRLTETFRKAVGISPTQFRKNRK